MEFFLFVVGWLVLSTSLSLVVGRTIWRGSTFGAGPAPPGLSKPDAERSSVLADYVSPVTDSRSLPSQR
jgi:hypothetical protein